MEPKFEGDSNHYNFPSEPSLGGNQKQRDIPKIVPADLKKPPEDFKLPTASVRPAEPVSAPQPSSDRPKDPKALMASLSKDISELSAPLKKEDAPKEIKAAPATPDPIEKFGVKGSDGVILPPEDDLGDPSDPSRTPGIIRSIMLFICLCFVILAAWQVNTFPAAGNSKERAFETLFLSKAAINLYCPPLRTPVVLSNQVNAVSPGQWELKLQIQNQDMRTQKLPVIQLTLEGAGSSRIQKIFEPAEYKTDPKIETITGAEPPTLLFRLVLMKADRLLTRSKFWKTKQTKLQHS